MSKYFRISEKLFITNHFLQNILFLILVFQTYMCYIYYVISRRRLHKLAKLVFYPFCLYEQIKLLYTNLQRGWAILSGEAQPK
jgi:hypothetical protein